jgi:hypothetical protein
MDFYKSRTAQFCSNFFVIFKYFFIVASRTDTTCSFRQELVHKLDIIHIPCNWPCGIFSNSLHWYTSERISVELCLNSVYGFVLIYTRCNRLNKSYLCIVSLLSKSCGICTTFHVRQTNSYSITGLDGP